MVTQEQLAEVLRKANVNEVAREAQVSPKTIYRLRHKRNSPTLAMVERLLDAVNRLNERKAA